MKHRRQAAVRAERLLELPGGVLSGQARIELCGNGCARVEGCTGILAYEPGCICIRTVQGTTRFRGEDLHLRVLEGRYTEVLGRIVSVELEG